MIASLLSFPELFSVFRLISTILKFGWSGPSFDFLLFQHPFLEPWGMFQVHHLQLVSLSPACSSVIFVLCQGPSICLLVAFLDFNSEFRRNVKAHKTPNSLFALLLFIYFYLFIFLFYNLLFASFSLLPLLGRSFSGIIACKSAQIFSNLLSTPVDLAMLNYTFVLSSRYTN